MNQKNKEKKNNKKKLFRLLVLKLVAASRKLDKCLTANHC